MVLLAKGMPASHGQKYTLGLLVHLLLAVMFSNRAYAQGTCTVQYPRITNETASRTLGCTQHSTQVLIPDALFTSCGRITQWTMSVTCNNNQNSMWTVQLQVWQPGTPSGIYTLRSSENVFVDFLCVHHVLTFNPTNLLFETGDILGLYTSVSQNDFIQMCWYRDITSDLTQYYEAYPQETRVETLLLSNLTQYSDRVPIVSVQVTGCECSSTAILSSGDSTSPITVHMSTTSSSPTTRRSTTIVTLTSTLTSFQMSTDLVPPTPSTDFPPSTISTPTTRETDIVILAAIAAFTVLAVVFVLAITAGVCMRLYMRTRHQPENTRPTSTHSRPLPNIPTISPARPYETPLLRDRTYDEISGDGSLMINPAYISSNPSQAPAHHTQVTESSDCTDESEHSYI